MQLHTLKWQADTDAHPAGEIVTAVRRARSRLKVTPSVSGSG
jgi:hypothetical protein